jgi:hypothetical protein
LLGTKGYVFVVDVKWFFENDFSEIVKRVSKIHNLLILAPKIVK